MKTQQIFPPLLWTIVGAMICVGSVSLKLGSWRSPEPGLFPFLIGCALIVISSFQIVGILFCGTVSPQSWPKREGFKRIALILMMLGFFAATLKYLGFVLCTFIFFSFLVKLIGRTGWVYAVFSGISTSFFSYLLFGVLLKINLPEGLLGF